MSYSNIENTGGVSASVANFEDAVGKIGESVSSIFSIKEETSIFDYEDRTYNYGIARAVRKAHMYGDGYDPDDESKYKLTDNKIIVDGHVLYQIEATRDITLPDGTVVKAGEKGGYVESHANLSSEGNCWVGEDAKVYDLAVVEGDALVSGHAQVGGMCYVGGSATVNGHASMRDAASVTGEALVTDNAILTDSARVTDQATVSGNATLEDHAIVKDSGLVTDNVHMRENASVSEKGAVMGDVQMKGESFVKGEATVSGHTVLMDKAGVKGTATYGSLELANAVRVLSGNQVVGGDGIFGKIPGLVSGKANPAVTKELESYRNDPSDPLGENLRKAFDDYARETGLASMKRGFGWIIDPDGPNGERPMLLQRENDDPSLPKEPGDGVSKDDLLHVRPAVIGWEAFSGSAVRNDGVTGVAKGAVAGAVAGLAAGAGEAVKAAKDAVSRPKYSGIEGADEADAADRSADGPSLV